MVSPRCAQTREALSAYIDGELMPKVHLQVKKHLAICPACAAEVDALRAVAASVRDLPRPELPTGFHDALIRKVKAEVAAGTVGATDHSRRGLSSALGSLGDFLGRLSGSLQRYPLRGAAAVAGLLIFVLWAGSFAFYMGLPVPGAEFLGFKRSSDSELAGNPGLAIGLDSGRQGGNTLAGEGVSSSGVPPTGKSGSLGSLSASGRQIIINVNLTMECEKVEQARDRAMAAAEATGGFVESLNYWTDSQGNVVANMVLRVPTASLSGVLEQLRGLGTVLGEQASRADVTAQHIDLTARINNLRLQEQSLLALLGKAESLGDVFALQSELARIRTEIESYESQLRYLEEQVALSTICLGLQSASGGPGPTSGFWERIVDAFLRSFRWLGRVGEQLVLFVAGALAPLAILGGLGWLGWRAVQARKRRAGL
jgi:hypothetical protein